MDPYDYVGGNPETKTDPTGDRFVTTLPGEDSPPPTSTGYEWVNTYTGGTLYTGNTNSWAPTPQPQPQPSAPPPPWQNIWNTVTNTVTNVTKTVAKAVINVGDQVLGISSMVHDFQTIFGGNASAWDKILAGGDLLLNGAMDISMFLGVGEMARGVYALGRFGGEMVVKDLEEQVEKEGEKGLETALENCGLSFSASTPVSTAAGKDAIATLKVGEKVWSYNPKTKKMELQPISHVWINHDNDLVDVALTTTVPATKGHPAHQETEVIHTNQKHPFLTTEDGFVTVANLVVGMHIVEGNGREGEIVGWQIVAGASMMYNLEVAQDHTFTVGNGLWVVHNCDSTTLGDNMSNAGTPLQPGQQAHHLIPCQCEAHPLVQAAGIDLDTAENGVGLYSNAYNALADGSLQHSGYHSAYNKAIGGLLDMRYDDLVGKGTLNAQTALGAVQNTMRDARYMIQGMGIEVQWGNILRLS